MSQMFVPNTTFFLVEIQNTNIFIYNDGTRMKLAFGIAASKGALCTIL
jgi:hypothetical protein